MTTPAHLEGYISNWKRNHKQTISVMKVAPSDKFEWKTCESAMTLGALMNHLWQAESGLVEAALTASLPKTRMEPLNNTEDLIAAFETSHVENVSKVCALTPEQMKETVTPFGEANAMTRQALLHGLLEHEIHHRGQLYTYLRILGVELPPLFG